MMTNSTGRQVVLVFVFVFLVVFVFVFVFESVLNLYLYLLRNLNPFEVLQIDPDASVEDAKKRFRRMSIMVGKLSLRTSMIDSKLFRNATFSHLLNYCIDKVTS